MNVGLCITHQKQLPTAGPTGTDYSASVTLSWWASGPGGCSFAAGMKASGMRKQERTRGKELGRAEPSVIGLNVKHAVTSE